MILFPGGGLRAYVLSVTRTVPVRPLEIGTITIAEGDVPMKSGTGANEGTLSEVIGVNRGEDVADMLHPVGGRDHLTYANE